MTETKTWCEVEFWVEEHTRTNTVVDKVIQAHWERVSYDDDGEIPVKAIDGDELYSLRNVLALLPSEATKYRVVRVTETREVLS